MTSPIDALSLVIEHSRVLTANQRHAHPAGKAAKAAVLRNAMELAARSFPRQGPSLVVVTIQFPRNATRRDPANWHDSVKPMMDGIVRAGVLPDDSSEFVQGPLPIIGDPDPSLSVTFWSRRIHRVRFTFAFHPMWSDFEAQYRVHKEVSLG